MKLVSAVIFSILMFSCINEKEREKSLIESLIIGNWTIDYMTDNLNEPVVLMHNIISFDKNGEFGSYFIEKGIWKIEQNSVNNFRMYLTSNNPDFKNPFDVQFIKDERNKLLKLKLESTDFSIVCSKMLFNYDRNINRINKLVETTKTDLN